MPFTHSPLRHVLLRQNLLQPFTRSSLTPHLRSYSHKKIPRGAPPPVPKTSRTRPKKFVKPAPKEPVPTQLKSPIDSALARASYGSLIQQLANAGRPTLLYAYHPALFVRGCYGFCGLGMAWMLYTYKANLEEPPPDLPQWVQTIQWVGIGMMGIVVGIFWVYPPRIAQKIIAIPVAATASRPATIKLEVHRRPLAPFLPMRKLIIENANSITLDQSMHQQLRKAEVLKTLPNNQSFAKRALAGLWGAPYRIFSAVRAAITNQNFVVVRTADDPIFMIHRNGWMWERRGLDRLFGTKRY